MPEKHPSRVEKYSGTIEELAEDIGNLDYKSLMSLFSKLSLKFYEDAEKDEKRGRIKLSSGLERLSGIMVLAEEQMDKINSIYTPYMNDK